MRNLWKCPHCGMTHEKTDRLMMLQRALESDAMMIGLMGNNPPCPHCGEQVNAVKLASGKYDFFDPKELQALERESWKLLGVLLLVALFVIAVVIKSCA
ncbi:MAG: hypothetical protein ACRD2L_21225 [Terriglobia bacterium]